jgi:hypothetical protein
MTKIEMVEKSISDHNKRVDAIIDKERKILSSINKKLEKLRKQQHGKDIEKVKSSIKLGWAYRNGGDDSSVEFDVFVPVNKIRDGFSCIHMTNEDNYLSMLRHELPYSWFISCVPHKNSAAYLATMFLDRAKKNMEEFC